ncbi:MAG: hypothetical protein DWQ04_29315, partial [Chloroflexi bacterium]
MDQPELRLSLLGGLTITRNGRAVSNFASRKVEALLAYLACDPRLHSRESLAALLWPNNDQTRALANLSVALSSLRKQLEPYILTERHTIGFNTETAFELDTAVFLQTIAQARKVQKQRGKLDRSGAAQLATAVSLYKGDFLAGFNIRGAPDFEAWALLEQERLRLRLLTALADLITFHQARHQLDDGIRYAQQLLAVDSLQEEAHRQLMQLYVQNNQRTAAIAQYEQCVAILADELGVEPDEETRALYEQIQAGGQGHKGAKEQSLPIPHSPAPLPSTPLHNLPTAVTSFIGREDELAQIEQWLGEPNGRLLTIVGQGGMGKTRLAQEAARAMVGQFVDGIWYVSLVPHTDISGVVTAVAEAINFTFSGSVEPATQLLNYLQSREMLLILDNMEHLLISELLALIAQLTEQAPDLRLIATSRERLQLQAETLLNLHGLPYPVTSYQYSVDSKLITDNRLLLTDYPAVQLFVNRVQRVQKKFQVAGQELPIAQLCQLVGGLPLALELAATWTRILSITEIVTEIQRGLDTLTTTLRDLPQRHRSIRTVIESSWQMLAADEQALFRKLAVFRGGFTREAAQEVANATLSQLISLVDRSFLRRDADQRFRRHPLLLQFAQEQLAAHPTEQKEIEANHAHFFADFVQARELMLQRAEAPDALAAIGADLENIRAAWQWALSPINETLLSKVVSGIGQFFGDRSRYLEGSEFFLGSLQMVQAQAETAVHHQIGAKVQVELGRFLYENGRFADAEATLKEANKLTLEHKLTNSRIDCLKNLGVVTTDQGEREASQHYLEEALQLCHASDNAYQKLLVLSSLGGLLMDSGDYDQARAYLDEAMTLAKSLDSTLQIAKVHNRIAIIANRQKDYHEALQQWKLARQGFKQLNHGWGLAATSHNIAMAYAGLEQYDAALENIQEAYAAHERIGHKRGMAGGLAVMGSIYLKLGEWRKARRNYYDSLLIAQVVGVTWLSIGVLVDVAKLEMISGNLQQAALLLTFSVQHAAIGAFTLANAQEL